MSQQQVAAHTVTVTLGGVEVVTLPLGPAIIALLVTLLVRLIIMTRARKSSVRFEVLVTALAMVMVLATCDGRSDMTAVSGAAIGLGYGALGVGIIEIGKSKLGGILGEAFRFILRSMLDTKPPTS